MPVNNSCFFHVEDIRRRRRRVCGRRRSRGDSLVLVVFRRRRSRVDGRRRNRGDSLVLLAFRRRHRRVDGRRRSRGVELVLGVFHIRRICDCQLPEPLRGPIARWDTASSDAEQREHVWQPVFRRRHLQRQSAKVTGRGVLQDVGLHGHPGHASSAFGI